MNDTLRIIVGLLETGKPEMQVAAAQVLGELRPKESAALKALQNAMRRSPVLGRFCLDAIAKLPSPDAIAVLTDVLVEGDPLADHAAHLLSDMGPAAHGALGTRFADALGETCQRILTVMARHLGKEAVPVFVRALLTPDLSDHGTRLLLAATTTLPPTFGKQLREGLARHLEQALPENCLANVVTVLARLDADGAKSLLLKFTEAEHPPAVRSAAFRALRGSTLNATQLRTLLELLEDQAQKDVHDAARDVLASLPELPEGALPVMKRLLLARQPEQRLFALRMLRNAGGAELAKFALKWLDHDDERFRAAALESLANNRQAADLVLRLLMTTKDAAVADNAAAVLGRQAANFSPKFTRSVAERAIKAMGGSVRVADHLLDIALAAGGAKVVPFLVDSAVRMRRAGRRQDALHVLARIASSTHVDDEVRYQLALTKLQYDAGVTAEGAAPGNSTMGFLAALVRGGFPLLERLRKENSLTPELLLRVATHFTDGVGLERRFGTDLLQHLATRTRGRAGDEAKIVLRAVGS